MDRILASAWRFDASGRTLRRRGGRWLDEAERACDTDFVWRYGRSEVRLTRDGDAWAVCYTSVGRLLGPRQVLYEARHKRATHAAWDVMARVIRASRDEDEGVRVARSAARWMRGLGYGDDDRA